MFKRVFIVAKTVLQGATRRSITGLPIHSTIRYFVTSITLFKLALSILKVCNFWRSNTTTQNHSVIRQVLISLANLVLSSGLGIVEIQAVKQPFVDSTCRVGDHQACSFSLFLLALFHFANQHRSFAPQSIYMEIKCFSSVIGTKKASEDTN